MMNNEPVAWKQIRAELNNEGDVIGMFTDISLNTGWEELPNGTPLYTHPVKEKGLPLSSPSPMNQACLTRSDNNTPIAWSCWSEGMQAAIITTTEPDMYGWQSIIPLFSHPVKELSRMDVYELAIESGFMLSTQYGEAEHKLMPVSDGDTLVKLAKAILRKAQEK